MGPEYVTEQINSRILELLLRPFCFLIIAPPQKVFKCFFIKRFPSNYKRYSRQLQMLILNRVAPIKVFLP